MDKETLAEFINQQIIHLVEIRSYSHIWLELHNAFQADAEYNAVYRVSPYFWHLLLKNLQHCFLLEAAKLFDESGESLSIQKTINICEQNQKLFPTEHKRIVYYHSTEKVIENTVSVNIKNVIKEAKEKYASVSETREKLFILRDKDLAHFDKKHSLDVSKLYGETALNRDKFDEMLCVAEEILNTFLSALTDTKISTRHCDVEDYERLLKVARKGIETEYPHLLTGEL